MTKPTSVRKASNHAFQVDLHYAVRLCFFPGLLRFELQVPGCSFCLCCSLCLCGLVLAVYFDGGGKKSWHEPPIPPLHISEHHGPPFSRVRQSGAPTPSPVATLCSTQDFLAVVAAVQYSSSARAIAFETMAAVMTMSRDSTTAPPSSSGESSRDTVDRHGTPARKATVQRSSNDPWFYCATGTCTQILGLLVK